MLVRATIPTLLMAVVLSIGALAGAAEHAAVPEASAQAAPPATLSERFEGSAERIGNIRLLLDVARAEYMDGNSLQAGELVREAYLNEFEFVEGDLDAAGQPLLRQSIETTLNGFVA